MPILVSPNLLPIMPTKVIRITKLHTSFGETYVCGSLNSCISSASLMKVLGIPNKQAPLGAVVVGERMDCKDCIQTPYGLDKVSLHTNHTELVSVWCGVAKRCMYFQVHTTLAVGPQGATPGRGRVCVLGTPVCRARMVIIA
jgi:hypothetical protein